MRCSKFQFALIIILLLIVQSCVSAGFKETNKTIQIWKTEDHKISLVLNQAWSGPANYQYLLYKKGLIKKKISVFYSGTTLDDDSCSITFLTRGVLEGGYAYIFDKCKLTVEKIKYQDKF